jgi:GAF domain-containing protein
MGAARTPLLVPMLKDDALVGLIVIYRKEVRPLTDKQIALVQNFRRVIARSQSPDVGALPHQCF